MRRNNGGAVRYIRWFFKRLFCRRNIIIISDHKTGHYPLSSGIQAGFLVIFASVVAFASYTTGNYMAAEQQLEDKQRKLESASLETKRVESEFALLKRDLYKLLNTDKELSEYGKFVIDQYQVNINEKDAEDVAMDSMNHDVIFERIAFLENTVEQLKNEQIEMTHLVQETTQGKIKELEKIIAMTGVNSKSLQAKARKIAAKELQASDNNGPQGGPYSPVAEKLGQRAPELYSDLKHLMLLHRIVETMPLSRPIGKARFTSGFGVRMDPFRKRLAQHNGLDFAGPHRTKIYAASAGKITFSGRKGAYGNCVDIDHGMGFITRYGHLSSIDVKKGDIVKQGDVVGRQGNTGRSTGSHLHYEVRYNGKPLNPKPFIKAGSYVQ